MGAPVYALKRRATAVIVAAQSKHRHGIIADKIRRAWAVFFNSDSQFEKVKCVIRNQTRSAQQQ